MKKLHEILGKKIIEGNCVGIEIEAEGDNISVTNAPYWKSEDDGSLRGAFPNQRHEFVSGVLSPDIVEKVLDGLINEQKNAKFDFSFRTSTHVHVNVLDMPVDKLVSFVYLYYLLEKDLLKYCGPHRENNRFCLRLVDSEYQLDILKGIIENNFRELRYLISEEMRYAACNMAALLKYGTLEFRGMRGSMDKKELLPWIGVLTRLKDVAMSAKSTYDLYKQALQDPVKFLRDVYAGFYDSFATEASVGNLSEALSITIEIPFTTQFWVQRIEEDEKEKERFAKRVREQEAVRNPNGRLAAHLDAAAVGARGAPVRDWQFVNPADPVIFDELRGVPIRVNNV